MVKERENRKPWGLLPTPGRRHRNNWPPYSGLLMIVILFAGFLLLMAKKRPFWELDAEGERQLTEWRRRKLEKELERLRNAEQYALIAAKDGFFPCYPCFPDTIIYLYRGEVWKYGVTAAREKGRYVYGLPADHLRFITQFRGNILECLEEEKKKIYYYSILPENMKRQKPIIRPPGNKQDN